MTKRQSCSIHVTSLFAIGCGMREPQQLPAPGDGGPPDVRDPEPSADSGTAKVPVTLASGQYVPNCLAVDGANVYWTTSDGNVLSVPTGGGTPTVLASSQGMPFGIAVDRATSSVYWVRTSLSSGMVMSIPIAGGAPRVLADKQRDPVRIAVDRGAVYWTNRSEGTVVTMPAGGGTPTELATRQGTLTDVAVGPHAVYWSAIGQEAIRSLPDGGEIATIAIGAHAVSLSVVGTTAYWADALLRDDGAGIFRLDQGRAPVELARSPSPVAAVADDRHVYWSDDATGTIRRVSIAGGEATVIATGQGSPSELAIDNQAVYWITEGSVMKLSK